MIVLTNLSPEQKATLHLTVEFNNLLYYLKCNKGLIRLDLAFKRSSGLYFCSLSDKAIMKLKEANDTDVVFTDEAFEEFYYGDNPSYNEIIQRFRQQPNDTYSLSQRGILLCEPSSIASFDEDTKAYAAPVGHERPIHSDLFNILFSCFIRAMKKIFTFEYFDALNQLPLANNQIYKEISINTVHIFLAVKIQGVPNETVGERLYETLCLVSSASYEKAPNHGRMGILTEGTESKAAYIGFSEYVEIDHEHVRQIRKLLEMSDARKNLLMIEKGKITGIYSPKDNYNNTEITFRGNGKWDFRIRNKTIISFDSVCFSIEGKQSKNEIMKTLSSVFGASYNSASIMEIIKEAKKQPHGTIIIISNQAASESERLSNANRATKIEPIKATKDAIRSITAIDGAVLVDPNGQCFAIGAILDGEAGKNGSPARGARYNSAITYVDYWNKNPINKIVAVIVSEDDSIDVYPQIDLPQK